MSKAHLPPVPPANRAKTGDANPGEGKIHERQADTEGKSRHIEQQGEEGNTFQNTRNQGGRQGK